MPPKVRITREQILSTAVELVRTSGEETLNARSLAAALSCSTQPLFSNFATMDELRQAVIGEADLRCQEYIDREVQKGLYPPYKASGIAYIRFAKEEKQLFRLLYMRSRTKETIPQETELGHEMESLVSANTGLSGDRTRLFHLEMWAFVHGIASMLATDYLDLDWELISAMLTDAYQGLKKRFEQEEDICTPSASKN